MVTRHIPLLAEEGWLRRRRRRGGRTGFPHRFAELTTPALRATPPLRGGELFMAAVLCVLLPLWSFAGTSDVADAAMNKNTAADGQLFNQKQTLTQPKLTAKTRLNRQTQRANLVMTATL